MHLHRHFAAFVVVHQAHQVELPKKGHLDLWEYLYLENSETK